MDCEQILKNNYYSWKDIVIFTCIDDEYLLATLKKIVDNGLMKGIETEEQIHELSKYINYKLLKALTY
jgi:hypothetical protein